MMTARIRPTFDRCKRIFRQRLDQTEPANLQRRQHAERESGEQRDDPGKGDDTPVERDVRQSGEVGRQQPRQSRMERGRQHDSRHATHQTEQRAFHEELPCESSQTCSERGAERELAAAPGRSGQLHARDARDRRHEQEPHGREERDDRRAHFARDERRIRHRVDQRFALGAEDRDVHHPWPRAAARARGRLGGGLVDRRSRPQPCYRVEHRQRLGRAFAGLHGRDAERQPRPDFGIRELKRGRHHADNGPRNPVDDERPADDVRCPAKALTP
jgi:hypothetical protein